MRDVSTISMRVPNAQLEEIDRRARKRGVTRSALMIGATLDLITADEERFRELEDEIGRLKHRLDLNGL
jgi:hypothetical protein